MSPNHPFTPMATPRAHCLVEIEPTGYDRRLIGFHLRAVTAEGETQANLLTVMGLGTVFHASFGGTTIPIAVASTARAHDPQHWEVTLGRASGVEPMRLAPGLFRIGHEGVDVPVGLGGALWVAVPFSAPIPKIDAELLWTYRSTE